MMQANYLSGSPTTAVPVILPRLAAPLIPEFEVLRLHRLREALR